MELASHYQCNTMDDSSEEELVLDLLANATANKTETLPKTSFGSSIKPKASLSRTGSEEPPAKYQKLPSTSRLTRSSLQLLAGLPSDDGDDVVIPTIFKTHAKENERLLAKDAKIQDELRHDIMKVNKEFQSLSKTKDAIVTELNDNGCDFDYNPANLQHNQLIEALVKKSLKKPGEFAFTRHFFFYSEVGSIDLEADTMLSPQLMQIALFSGKNDRFYQKYVTNRTKEFIQFVLVKVTNVTHLKLVKNIFETSLKPSLLLELSLADFQQLITACGGDHELISTTSELTLPIKLNVINNFSTLLLYRLAIVFYGAMEAKADNELYFTVLRAFLLSLSDFNLNNNLLALHDTLLDVFPRLVTWRMLYFGYQQDWDAEKKRSLHDTMVYEWNNVLDQTFNCRLYNDSTPISLYHDYELTYNVYRLIDLAFDRIHQDPFTLRFLTSIKLSFITDQDYVSDPTVNKHASEQEFTFSQRESGSQLKLLHSTMQKIGKINALDVTRASSFDAINTLYKSYFKLLLFNSVIYNTFTSNQDTADNRAQYETIKAANLSQLKKLERSAFVTRDKFHAQLGQVILIPNKVSPFYHKDDLVKVITDIYYVLNYFHLWLTKDILLLHEDIFYDNNANL